MTKRATDASAVARPPARARDSGRTPQHRSFKKLAKTYFSLAVLTVMMVVATALVCMLAAFWKFSTELPNVEDLVDTRPPIATTIVSEDGVELGRLEVENRQPVTLDEVPKTVKDATIAIEDHRFYEHRGVDLIGIGRAAVANLRGSSLSQGGSTLTQQLVRNLNQLGISKEKKYSRKFREALTALRMEQVYSKQEILQLYLNNVYYGAGAYGIEAASQTYFHKPAAKLDLAEAALLAGLPQRPSAFTPFEHYRAALKRREEVLDRMQEYGYISAKQAEDAKSTTPKLAARPKRHNYDFKAPYFVTFVLREVARKFGSDYLYKGIKIETTLNWKMQEAAEKALEDGLDRASGRQANQGALVSIDNNTGYIRAMVGGRSFRADQYNAVTQGRRQPGSTFKLFVYSAAFDTGTCNLDSVFPDETFYYRGDPKHRSVKGSGSSMSLLSAIQWSKNAVAIRVADKVGIRTVIDYAKKMGITSPLDPLLPTALGASSVRPLELCSAYSTIPMKGNRCQPMGVIRVTDAEGNILDEFKPEMKTDILKPETTAMLDRAFEAVVHGGTGTRARGDEATGIVENAHGKTGTTNDNRDVWFAGYTPELTTVVWVASVHRVGKRKVYQTMPGAFGGIVCAPIWHDFMMKAVPEQRKFILKQQVATSDSVTPEKKVETGEKKPASSGKTEKPKTTTTTPTKDASPDSALDTPPGMTDPDANPDQDNPTAGTPEQAAPTTTEQPENFDATANPGGASAGGANKLRTSAPNQTAPTARAAPRKAEPEMVSVRICVDSGQLATNWCEATKTIQVSRREANRMRRCRQHKPPPGEGE